MKFTTKKVITYFFQGLLALLPLIVTGYVAFLVLSIVKGLAGNVLGLLPESLRDIGLIYALLEGLFIVAIFLAVVFFGMIVGTMVGSNILKLVDGFFAKVPGLNKIYDATKQVAGIFSSGKKQFFTQPVLVQYPSPGIWAVAFNTGEAGEIYKEEGKGISYTVFIPTTPNPTSGFLAIVHEDQIKKIDISVEDAIKLILTGGMVKSGINNETAAVRV